MRNEDSTQIVEAVDGLLLPLGFGRRANSQNWTRVSEPDRAWVHLNFGKFALINPSFGVQFPDLSRAFPELPAVVDGTVRMLSGLFQPPRQYSSDAPLNQLVEDLRDRALPDVAALQDRRSVIDQLRSPSVADWPVASYSHRIRLLPLLLATEGRVREALDAISQFETDAVGRDQIRPGYDQFVRAFRATVSA